MITTKRLLFAVISILVVLLAFSAYNLFFVTLKSSPSSAGILVIDKNTSAKSFVKYLKKNRIYNNDKLLLVFLKVTGKSKRLKAGVFAIKNNESVMQLLVRIENFDVLKKNFQIIAGTTNSQIATNLQKASLLNYSYADWQNVISCAPGVNTLCSENCMHSLCNIENPEDLEGLFLADTYSYDAGCSAVSILKNANSNLKKHLLLAWQNRQSGLPYNSPYELLIAASILEKESSLNDERRVISGVIVNRLQKKMPLQMDPTVIYGLRNNYSGKLTHEDLQIINKYNTYKIKGLPPTPIAVVSKDAIYAASNPKLTDYLYFVATGNGEHVFSKTYAEQRAAIKKYHRNTND